MDLYLRSFWNCSGSWESYFTESKEAKWGGSTLPRGGRAANIRRGSLKEQEQYLALWVGTTVLVPLSRDLWSAHASALGLSRAHAAGLREIVQWEQKQIRGNWNPSRSRFHSWKWEQSPFFFLMTDSCYLERSLGFVLGSFVYNTRLYILMWSWWIIFWWFYCSGCQIWTQLSIFVA